MKDEELKRIEDSIINDIDSKTKLEQELHEKALECSYDLLKRNRALIELQDSVYKLQASFGKKDILIIAVDIDKFRLLREKATVIKIVVDMEQTLTRKENLRAAVEAFARHVYGITDIGEVN